MRYKKENKMKTPLTNMEDRWVHSTKEAFDALVAMGYEPLTTTYHIEGNHFLEVINNNKGEPIIYQLSMDVHPEPYSKQAYYHKGRFYDQPYEEFTITDEKVPFPELEDIEWVKVDAPEWWPYDWKSGKVHLMTESFYNLAKLFNENSNEFKVSFKLKEKINRKLHENRPLALAIGKVLDESRTACIDLSDGTFIQYVSSTGEYFMVYSGSGTNVELYDVSACTLPDDYIIPDQVLQWMKEYDHTS